MNPLDHIPAGRRVAVIAAHKLARDMYDERGEADELQRKLTPTMEHTRSAFIDVVEALANVKAAGEAFDHVSEERAIEALGLLAVECARMCELNALSIRPVFDLARLYTRHESTSPRHALIAIGNLATVVGSGNDRVRLTDAIGFVLAKALEEVEIVHELRCNLPAVYDIVALEVLTGRKPMVETVGAAKYVPADGERKARALYVLQGGIDDLANAAQAEPGDFDLSDAQR